MTKKNELLCQNYAPLEVADLLYESKEDIKLMSIESKQTLARWLAELHYLRNVKNDIRIGLADTERALERNFP